MTSRKRKVLTLTERVSVIKQADKFRLSARKLAEVFQVGKTQIQAILKGREDVLKTFEDAASNPSKKRKVYASRYVDVNSLVYEWFVDVSGRGLCISGTMLQEKALHFSKGLGFTEFKASNGWLEAFKSRYGIVYGIRAGEKADVDESTVLEWKKQLNDVCEGYLLDLGERDSRVGISSDRTINWDECPKIILSQLKDNKQLKDDDNGLKDDISRDQEASPSSKGLSSQQALVFVNELQIFFTEKGKHDAVGALLDMEEWLYEDTE